MKVINLWIPPFWLKLIDQARKDRSRSEWIRDVIRDALKDQGAWQ
ncbi:ribbon-helix-helix domain-containing protein [Candidatus Bathyarchaeota archaeon]|nr:ribbon-helix-helix domain-containing protein [Candidatus Bathyarchaeota archaeon]